MKRVVLLVVICAMLFMGFAGCAETEVKDVETESASEEAEEVSSDDVVKIGFSIQDISNESWSVMWTYMQAYADELGVEITLKDCQGDEGKQIDSLENFIQGGYDAIIVHAFSSESCTSTLQAARDKGIKIIAYDTMTEVYDAYYGLDNYAVGMQIAQNAANWIDATFEGGACDVAICNYPLNQVCLDRAEGIEAGLAEYAPNATVVGKAQAGYTDEGLEAGENFIQAYPDLKCVVGIDDAGLLGVYQAYKAADKLEDDFGLHAIDALDAALELISSDSIYRSTIWLDLNTVGEEMVQAAYDLVEGNETEEIVYFPMKTITIDNVAEFMD